MNKPTPAQSSNGIVFCRLKSNVADSAGPAFHHPQRSSFEEFLLRDARVPIGGGEYGSYSFDGREAILGIVRRIDSIVGCAGISNLKSQISNALPDSLLGVAGGAQWGKTILELNLAAYLTSQRWLACGIFLPGDDLVQGIVDTKFRPDVIDQIPWFASMTLAGKAVNKSGKTANRKGAFLVTDGTRKTTGMVLGLQKIPTSYTFDVTLQDEVDDIPEKNAKFVKGRRTSSNLRFDVRIGTQRIHGRGQNKVWKDGSQGVVIFGSHEDSKSRRNTKNTGNQISLRDFVSSCENLRPGDEVMTVPSGWINPEENFPQIIRCQTGNKPCPSDPRLTWAGDFKHVANAGLPDSGPSRHGAATPELSHTVTTHKPGNIYYLAHPVSGAPLDRRFPLWHHRQPGQFSQRNFTYRASQLGFDAIGLGQIVNQFQLAVADPDEMIVFRCDVLALPQSTAQSLTPAILDRARSLDPFPMRLTANPGCQVFGGLDTGDRCWFVAREVEHCNTPSGIPVKRRIIHAASIAAGDMITRGRALFEQFGMSCLFIDQRPLVSQARSLALILNGLDSLEHWPKVPESRNAYVSLPGGLAWDGRKGEWTGLKCAVVRFDKKQIGAGIGHDFDIFEEDGRQKFVPLIRCNRFETIDRAVREFLTPTESVMEIVGGKVRETPAILLPDNHCPILETLDAHLITGSERSLEKDGAPGDYSDRCANHLLLADAYSALAETGETPSTNSAQGRFYAFERAALRTGKDRTCIGA